MTSAQHQDAMDEAHRKDLELDLMQIEMDATNTDAQVALAPPVSEEDFCPTTPPSSPRLENMKPPKKPRKSCLASRGARSSPVVFGMHDVVD